MLMAAAFLARRWALAWLDLIERVEARTELGS